MDNMNPMNREMKKQQRRRQIVSDHGRGGSYPGPFDEEDEEGEEEREGQRQGTRLKRWGIVALVVLVLTAAVSGGTFYWKRYHQYTEYSISWEQDLFAEGEGAAQTESTFVGYLDFGENIIRYTKDGASYIDARGKTVWVQTYEMRSPIAAVNGDYAVVADQQGTAIYIFDKNGCQGVATALLPILKVSVSGKGVAAAILEDPRSNYIAWFRKDGAALDITVKVKLSGDGYPIDISLSPDGTQILCSYMYMNNGMLDCRVVFYNFSEVGKNTGPTRIVGGFDEPFAGGIVPRVHFLDDVYSFACSDKGLTFFSSKNLTSPEILRQVMVESDILSLFYSSGYVGMILANAEGEYPYRMEIYRPTGDLVLKKEFDFRYRHVAMSGERVLLWDESSFKAYNLFGTEVFTASFEDGVDKVTLGRHPNSFIVTGPQKMREITLQR